MAEARGWHTATLLPDGRVLATGGYIDFSSRASAEVYDPSSDTWDPTVSMATGRYEHTAVLLPYGRVLVAAGVKYEAGTAFYLDSAEVYNIGFIPPTPTSCTVELGVSHSSGILDMTLTIESSDPAIFNLWLVVPPTPIFVPLTPGIPLPAIDPPATVTKSFPFPSLGIVGFLATMRTAEGTLICGDLAIVNTGTRAQAGAAPPVEALQRLFSGVAELLKP
jgi:hypothetical protein